MDRITAQIIFKRVLWTCPSCGQEDTEDFNVGGGNTYEHDCSKCSAHFNQSGLNMIMYNGCINVPEDEYVAMTSQDIDDIKQSHFEDWIYKVKNPPTYTEPSKEDYKKMYEDRMQEANTYLTEFAKKATAVELTALKGSLEAQVLAVDEQITAISEIPPVEDM